jgi:hypothetical protein
MSVERDLTVIAARIQHSRIWHWIAVLGAWILNQKEKP